MQERPLTYLDTSKLQDSQEGREILFSALLDRCAQSRDRFVVVLEEIGNLTVWLAQSVEVGCISDNGVSKRLMLEGHCKQVVLEGVIDIELEGVMMVGHVVLEVIEIESDVLG